MGEMITEDMVEELMYAANRGGTSTHLAAAEALHEWSTLDATQFGDYVSAASLLVSAGEHFALGGDSDRAVRQFRLAVEATGDAPPDTRVYLLQGLLDAGFTEEAQEVADTIRRERPVDADVYVFIAESFELVGDHRRAQRWFSMGLRLADDRDVQLSEFDYELLLMGRRRVRQAAGMPEDVLDASAKEVLEQHRIGA